MNSFSNCFDSCIDADEHEVKSAVARRPARTPEGLLTVTCAGLIARILACARQLVRDAPQPDQELVEDLESVKELLEAILDGSERSPDSSPRPELPVPMEGPTLPAAPASSPLGPSGNTFP